MYYTLEWKLANSIPHFCKISAFVNFQDIKEILLLLVFYVARFFEICQFALQ